MAKKPTNGQKAVEDRYARFVAEYLLTNNATQAAIAAGYSAKTAKSQAHRLLTNATIIAQIESGRVSVKQEAAAKLAVTSERVVAELAKIGFLDPRKALKWSMRDHAVGRGKTKRIERRPEMEWIDSDLLDDDTAGAISEVSMTAHGMKLKFYDKRAALVDLGKVTGVFADGVDVTVPIRFVIEKGGK